MVEYIEREALIKKFNTDTRVGFYGDFTDGSETAYTSAEVNAIIVNAPAVDVVEIKHGEWVRPTIINGRTFDIPHCSVCDDVPCDTKNYCPNCGAKMDGKGD